MSAKNITYIYIYKYFSVCALESNETHQPRLHHFHTAPLQRLLIESDRWNLAEALAVSQANVLRATCGQSTCNWVLQTASGRNLHSMPIQGTRYPLVCRCRHQSPMGKVFHAGSTEARHLSTPDGDLLEAGKWAKTFVCKCLDKEKNS